MELVLYVYGLAGYVFPLNPMSTWGLVSIAVGVAAVGFLKWASRPDMTSEDESLAADLVGGDR